MSFNFGNRIRYTLFGQSHSEEIGCVIDGLPAGEIIDFEKLTEFMKRRAPGRNELSTPRKEADRPRIVSGIADGKTCGAPLCVVIENTNARSSDYEKLKYLPRPSHSDYAAYVKYGGNNDIRGGGAFSGRMTAPLCAAGGILMQLLERRGIEIASHVYSVGKIHDRKADAVSGEMQKLKEISAKEIPVFDEEAGEKMKELILKAKENSDSVGGVIECVITGVQAGTGGTVFGGIENRISSAVFSVPAVKGIEFGLGFESAEIFGSENNDEFYYDKTVKTKTNNHGGILGGIASGMPIIFRAAIKPTPSIGLEQNTVNLLTNESEKLVIGGRHDPCIVLRALPAIESAAALAVADMIF